MIQIICSREAYVYNVYHMVKAFYPSKEVTSRVEEKASNYVTVFSEDIPEIKITEEMIKGVDKSDIKEIKYQIDCLLYQD